MNSNKESFESLMPVINPNLDEIVVEGKNEPLQDLNPTRPKPTDKDIFQSSNKKKNVKLSVAEKKSPSSQKVPQADITEGRKEEIVKDKSKKSSYRKAKTTSVDTDKKVQKPKRNYDHLKKAREKALANRKAKAEAKKKLREAEKEEKKRLKEEKKQLRIAKNRERARENYHKKKDLKEQQIVEKIEKIEEPQIKQKIEKEINNGSMDYKKFAMFMSMYEREKALIANKKKKSKPIPIPKKKEVKVVNRIQSKHPPNYYIPKRSHRQDVNDLFRL